MKRKQMEHEQMTISEVWRWRFLAIWVVVFTILVVWVLYKVHDVARDNREALCAIHRTHVTSDRSLKILLERNGLPAGEITVEIQAEEAALDDLGCTHKP